MGWTSAATAAHRVGTYAAAISEAHMFGFGPGDVDDLSTVLYQEKAVHVYAENLPWPYLLATARGFERNAEFMTVNAPPADCPDASWIAVSSYLRSAVHVLTTYAPEGITPDDYGVTDHTPSVMPFRELATIATLSGSRRLEQHSRLVAAACHAKAGEQRSPLDGDTERIMRMLADGRTIADVSATLHLSERSIYRKLQAVHDVTGTTTRTQLVAHLMERGWL